MNSRVQLRTQMQLIISSNQYVFFSVWLLINWKVKYFGSDAASFICLNAPPTSLSDWLHVTSKSLYALSNLNLQSNLNHQINLVEVDAPPIQTLLWTKYTPLMEWLFWLRKGKLHNIMWVVLMPRLISVHCFQISVNNPISRPLTWMAAHYQCWNNMRAGGRHVSR